MNATIRDTFSANTLWRVTFEGNIRHAVPAYQPPHHRTIYYPLTWPDLDNGRVRITYTLPDQILIRDRYLGVLPVVANDEYTARAISENWNARVNSMFRRPVEADQPPATGEHAAQVDQPDPAGDDQFDPTDLAMVWRWGLETVRRSPRIRLITEIQWPPGLPPTPFHPQN